MSAGPRPVVMVHETVLLERGFRQVVAKPGRKYAQVVDTASLAISDIEIGEYCGLRRAGESFKYDAPQRLANRLDQTRRTRRRLGVGVADKTLKSFIARLRRVEAWSSLDEAFARPGANTNPRP